MPVPTFDTLRREQSFRHPPTDVSAFPALHEAISPHIDSFNAMTEERLLEKAVEDIGKKCAFDDPRANNTLLNRQVWVSEVQISKPMVPAKDRASINRKVYPSECRERLTSYRGRLILQLKLQLSDGIEHTEAKDAGPLPILVRSNRCHTQNLPPSELVLRGEESEELGGYFIVNGIEKVVRMLIVTKRNHPLAIVRPSFANKGKNYSQFGIQIRCVREDQSGQTNTLHYLTDGTAVLRFSWRKNEYLVPFVMILKACVDCSDKEIFDAIVGTEKDNTFLTDRVELLLRGYKPYQLYSKKETLQFLGEKFRVVLAVAEDMSDEDVGGELLRKIILIHLKDWRDKFRLLIFTIRKLYALVAGDCAADSPDSPQHQEILLGGFLYNMIIKEKIEDYLNALRQQMLQDVSKKTANFHDKKYISKVFTKVNADIGSKLTYFLSTGNLVSNSGLDLQQTTGYTIVAEKINFYRYLSHFRCVHRGSFFAELKTTTVRKLLPEAWGFLCPVHTPDGSPCGLLNHLAHQCKVITSQPDVSALPSLLVNLGISKPSVILTSAHKVCIQLDGKIIGWCTHNLGKHIAETLRYWKINDEHNVPKSLEIGYVPKSNGGQYPGLYLFSTPARMVRPVRHLATDKEDLVGPFEQVYMEIACMPQDIHKETTHIEFKPSNMLSIIANLTPFSDFNQSPRNMYQCQMGKQTMGTPGSAIAKRTDNKIYRLQTAQTPIVRPKLHDIYGFDHYPNGTNAVVAVISYTGYDMEDAMILNKSAHERGFGYGTLYKSEIVDLSKYGKGTVHFGFGTNRIERWRQTLDEDGYPMLGAKLSSGDPVAAYWDEITGQTKCETYHGTEDAYIDEVRLLGNDTGDSECQIIHVKLRITRSPTIGDKFSSRHGQKGVCSQKWPAVDMPFTESGMQPDVIINPHAFPSRMTIGMFVESLAGKAGALHGMCQDSTPFTFNEEDTAADFFGHQLVKAGYNYRKYGNEPMYSGITGHEMYADIYIGVVYYQRLRHMVNDKFQVRTVGPIHNLTHQPVKGRKRGGGIRFGEMERDAIIAHGSSFILQDRLLNCSDYTQSWICKACGTFFVRCRACAMTATGFEDGIWEDGQGNKWVGGEDVTVVTLPYVFKYLTAELAAMGIKLSAKIE
ncbi:putative DNA-directed RNA polymerase I subunit RPA2 [Neolecta irregularis DAH-3]|uniref:DNA-directed RNA polymerase subunit beta n=1 Tax=Neolecta irregularis (strain DAH-3) TaxID=1198029 RepID=A0A1U7LQM3_NEOID|nr:putative DNA-directed RNA polymerase I subunit RPA2 [Neolecta irregularis DAH-3]|eukprot:OLL24928.1 putative DNA-directed RNA polymerase I subunit RPA2 [Neolecta irregularis DAH-3]